LVIEEVILKEPPIYDIGIKCQFKRIVTGGVMNDGIIYRYKGYKTIRFPINESHYEQFMNDINYARNYINTLITCHPELFPEQIKNGYCFYGYTDRSVRTGISCRRIDVHGLGIFTLSPGFVMPYMTAKTAEVEKGMLLLRFCVPCWVVAYILGYSIMFWYRLHCSLGRNSLVGSTIKSPDKLPKDLAADEKHTWLSGEKSYVATTVANECILGASLAESASEPALTKAYGVFADEAQNLKPNYQPETANTDGWFATQNAWQRLFPSITIILCFLHAFLKIRDRATQRLQPYFRQLAGKVWDAYHATTKRCFSQRIRRIKEWAVKELEDSSMKEKLLDLCAKKDRFIKSYDHPNAHRTSNMVDRLMRILDRAFFMAQYFHSSNEAAELRVRAIALLWNFCPSSPQTVKKHGGKFSPAERLNNCKYHDNWLQNLIISTSMNGFRYHQQNPL
jgi:hypothetical protein